MLSVSKSVYSTFMKKQNNGIKRIIEYPIETQNRVFFDLIARGQSTLWGKEHKYSFIHSVENYRDLVPVMTYEDYAPYFERIKNGEQNLLWDKVITMFAKSSGTTTGKSKFIPVSREALPDCHYKGGRDMIAMYLNNVSHSKLLFGKNISVTGSHSVFSNAKNSYLVGDISALLVEYLPFWAELIKIPPKKYSLISNWEDKIKFIADYVVKRNVVSLLGVPSWMLFILRTISAAEVKSIEEIWPDLEVFFHGGVAFKPYKNRYNELITNKNMKYMEVYNASEGYFAIQNDLASDDMLLLLDHGVFYEFIPLDKDSVASKYAVTLDDVKVGENYAMVITTNSGLWRYKIGDTVSFTSKYPFKIKITGRTKAYINVVGEELVVENAETAIDEAAKKTCAVLSDFTVAPLFYEDGKTVAHEWLVEFETSPEDMDLFADILDETLQNINSDYKAKRFKDMVIKKPVIREIPRGTFYKWFKNNNKLGGQNKIRRLSNDRDIVEEIYNIVK